MATTPAPIATPTAPPAVPATESMKDAPPHPEIDKIIQAGKEHGATPEAQNRASLIGQLQEFGFEARVILELNSKITEPQVLVDAESRIAKVKELTMQDENALIADYGKLLHESGDPHLLTLALAQQSTNATPLGRQLRREAIESIQKFTPAKNKDGTASDTEKPALALRERSTSVTSNHTKLYLEDKEQNALHDFAKNHTTDFGEKTVEAIKLNSVDAAPVIGDIMGKNSPLALDLWRALSGDETATALPTFTPESILALFGFTPEQIPGEKMKLQANIAIAQEAYKKAMEGSKTNAMAGHMPHLGPASMALCGSAALIMLMGSFMGEGEAKGPQH